MGEGGKDTQTDTHTDRQTDRHTHTHKQTDRHINTMTRPGLGAGPSEKHMGRGQHETYKQTDMATTRLIRPRGPSQ